MKRLFIIMLFAAVTVPVSAIVTFLLIPVWRWFEQTAAVESIGHSGPATWCYGVVYLFMLAAGLVIRRVLARRNSNER
jgi:hypothetical protein